MNPKKLKKIKKSFFKEGSLVYEESNHKLIKSGNYYRCSKSSNQKCDYGEKQILTANLERSFSRMASKLYSSKFPAEKVIEYLLRDNFWDITFGVDDRIVGQEAIIDSTLAVMQQDVEETGRVTDDMQTDFTDSLDAERKGQYPVLLLSLAVSFVQLVSSKSLSERERGRSLALFTNKVTLTKEGKIKSIKLERWAWYVLNNVIVKNQIDYMSQIKALCLSNDKEDPLLDKGMYEAALYYGQDGFEDAMGENFVITHSWISLIKESFSLALVSDSKKVQEGLPELFQKIRNDIPLNAMLSAISVIK